MVIRKSCQVKDKQCVSWLTIILKYETV